MLKVNNLEDRILSVRYEHLRSTANGVFTICHIELDNGYIVTGTTSSLSPQHFDEQQGKVVAYENAFEQLWQLFGFLEVEKNYRQAS